MSADLIYVPAGAVTMFEVGFSVEWWIHNEDGESVDDDDNQIVYLDLASDKYNFYVECPFVELGLLSSVLIKP